MKVQSQPLHFRVSPARAGSDFSVSFVLLPSLGSIGSSVSPAYGKHEEVGKKGEGGREEGKVSTWVAYRVVNTWREASCLAPQIFHTSLANTQACILRTLLPQFYPGFKLSRPGSGLFCPKCSSGNLDCKCKIYILRIRFLRPKYRMVWT